MQIIATE